MKWLMPVLHPAFTFRMPAALGPLSAHVENFVRRGVLGPPAPPKLLRNPSVHALDSLVQLARRLKRPLAVDVECGKYGRLPTFAEMTHLGVGLDDDADGIGLSWEWPPTAQVAVRLREVLLDKTLPKVLMNGRMYDRPVLKRHSVPMAGRLEDIRECRHTVASTSRVSLAHQASIYLCCGPWKAEVHEDEDDSDAKGFVDGRYIEAAKVMDYNAEDCVRTAQIWTHVKRELDEGGPRTRMIYEQLLRLGEVGSEMSRRGFPFDRAVQRHLAKELMCIFKREAKLLQILLAKRAPHFKITNTGGVNENELRALLYRDCARKGIRSFNLQVPLTDKCWTESGMPAVNKRALLYLYSMPDTPEEVRKVIKQCWRVDAPLKLRGTYVVSEKVEQAIGPDGRVHANINTCGPETYRWSCSRPNLFNLSEAKDEEALSGELPNVRGLYVAPPGFVIVHGDFKQLELFVMGDYTQDKTLLKMLATGDVHTARTREWFKLGPDEEVPKLLRKGGKETGLACQYGAGAETTYLTVLTKLPDAEWEEIHALHTLFPKTHPSVAQHWEDSCEFARQHGYSEAPIMEYRRMYPPGAPIKPQETSNFAIQSGAAAIANCVMVGRTKDDAKNALYYRLKREYPTAWLAMHTYDSFDIICRERDSKAVNQLLEECMRGPWQIGPKPRLFQSDFKTGQRWSEV